MTNGTSPDHLSGMEIAIVGMAGRFPGANGIEAFWQNLRDGVESIACFSEQDLLAARIPQALLRNPRYVKAGTILDGAEQFDAAFFGYSPREAELMDPQHRVFLECAWEALERAGYDAETFDGTIGLYAGVSLNSYWVTLFADPAMRAMSDFQTVIGNDRDFLTTRVSYKLNLKGPSVTVQTACSTSLVAVHLACQSLLSGESDLALAGGVSIMVPLVSGYLSYEGGITSPDGHCRAFADNAQGTIFGKGVGIVVLKRLSDALNEGDHILAVIKGSAINNDGALKVGYTAPSVDGQAQVIRMAQIMADVAPETVTYIEAHGTGTPLGDPIEIAALTQVFGGYSSNTGFCAIGSVKTNIGHLDAAAGIAGLIKTVLAFQHRQIPPSLHCERPNPRIDFAHSAFYVNTRLAEWKAGKFPRRAGVSSFGIGGTNAHVVLEEAPSVEPSGASRPYQLLLLSAKTPTALATASANLAAYLSAHPEVNLADVAYTLQVGRRTFEQRQMLLCRDCDEAVTALKARDAGSVLTQAEELQDQPVAFLFPGQGTQYVGMARDLYTAEPTFCETIDRCAELLIPHLGLDLRDLLYPDLKIEDRRWRIEDTESSILNPLSSILDLDQTWLAQPALFVVEYALARLWMVWGVRPQALIGHSVGEYVAACLAGVFSLNDALALVAARGRLMQQLPVGAMLAVSLPEQQVQTLLDGRISLAAVNGPSLCVVAGVPDAVAALEQRLAERGVACRLLHTSHAFHSTMMDPIVESFVEMVRNVALHPPTIPFVSNVTGTWIAAEQATDPAYWAHHLRKTVRFTEGIDTILQEPRQVLLEVGPGRTLSTFARQQPEAEGRIVLASLRHPQDPQPDVAFVLTTLGQLWLAGVRVDWAGFYIHERRRRLPLPTYPFERQRYWLDPQRLADLPQSAANKQPDMADWFYLPLWKESVPPMVAGAEALMERKRWLLMTDTYGVGAQITQRLEQAGQEVLTVVVGEGFARLGDRTYTVHPRQRADYVALFEDLQAQDKLPRMIIHLWTLTPDQPARSEPESLETAQSAGFYSLVFLAQALARQQIGEPLQIVVVSTNIQAVSDETLLHPEKATILGPCTVIPQEYPQIACRSIDIPFPTIGTRQATRTIDLLVAECAATAPDPIVAYRGNRRWVQTIEPVRLPTGGPRRPSLRRGGVYLIVGGLAGSGIALAHHLAQRLQANLILVAPVTFPPAEAWDDWLASHDPRDPVSDQIRHVRQLEELGASVLIVRADSADQEGAREAITRVHARFGVIHGVIYAATPSESLPLHAIQEIGPDVYDHLFQTLARWLSVLARAVPTDALDFCLLHSSLAGLTGGVGLVLHAAASRFMDAFAHKQYQAGAAPWICVDWDVWRIEDAGVPTPALPAWLADLAITPEEGAAVFERIVSLDTLPQVAVSTTDLRARIAHALQREPSHDRDQVGGEARALHPRPPLQTAYVKPSNEIEHKIAAIWQSLLGIEPIGIYDNFFALGGHSLLATQLMARVRETFRLEVPLRSIFETPTVADLAAAIIQQLLDQIDSDQLDAIERLSQDDVQAMLTAERQTIAGGDSNE